ncbi:hypothetical protein JTE90_024039 [Oedothorax gibbosus]|uniref:FPL domain-containing protein n=1 Tax=Oedothorax gibbosus TaxID=931172 RepID=A0AAV6VDF6_9ARAC|nr:hypothetical protein JTE90_024039 [Oedothorax gibbosus]
MLLYDYIKQPVKLSSQLSQVQAQDRPTLKTLVESINDSKDSETRILLAKSLLNFPMFSEEDQNYENATIYYINMIKIIVRELSTEMLNTLFDAETQDFPLLRSLMQYTHHCDVMIQNAAQIATTLLRNNGPFWLLIKDDYLIRIKELYLNICENLEYSDTLKFSSQIDESYKKWMENQKPDIFSVCFLSDQEFECKTSKDSQKEDLLKLLNVRYLCHQTNNRKEKILPILPPKIQNVQSLLVKNYIFCKIVGQKTKRTQSNIVILTSSQFLVLEHSEDQRGTVTFSCFYKDLMWSECKQNRLLLWEDCENKNPMLNNQHLDVPKILLEFGENDNMTMIVKTLPHAKFKQREIIQRKIDDLLELEVRKGRLKYGMK